MGEHRKGLQENELSRKGRGRRDKVLVKYCKEEGSAWKKIKGGAITGVGLSKGCREECKEKRRWRRNGVERRGSDDTKYIEEIGGRDGRDDVKYGNRGIGQREHIEIGKEDIWYRVKKVKRLKGLRR